jgi:hypothetical protein
MTMRIAIPAPALAPTGLSDQRDGVQATATVIPADPTIRRYLWIFGR